MSGRGVFVTGTDTGVGKTLVACALVRALRGRGRRVGVLKPVETGVGPEGPLDALALREAAASDAPIAAVCPQAFAMPAAPDVAARAEGREVDLAALDGAFEAARAHSDLVVVEGAGGLLVPVAPELCMADLAARWQLPLVLVARAALGTINHTRLSLEAAASRGLRVAGLVVSHAEGELSPADAANLRALLDAPGAPLLGVVPPLAAGALPPPDALDLDLLLAPS
jgi:dethiobiotin synthetase